MTTQIASHPTDTRPSWTDRMKTTGKRTISEAARQWNRPSIVDNHHVTLSPTASRGSVLTYPARRRTVVLALALVYFSVSIPGSVGIAQLATLAVTPVTQGLALTETQRAITAEMVGLVVFFTVLTVYLRVGVRAGRRLRRIPQCSVYCPVELTEDVRRSIHNLHYLTTWDRGEHIDMLAFDLDDLICGLGGVRQARTEQEFYAWTRTALARVDADCAEVSTPRAICLTDQAPGVQGPRS